MEGEYGMAFQSIDSPRGTKYKSLTVRTNSRRPSQLALMDTEETVLKAVGGFGHGLDPRCWVLLCRHPNSEPNSKSRSVWMANPRTPDWHSVIERVCVPGSPEDL